MSLINDENIDATLFGFCKGEIISWEKSNFDKIYLPVENTLNMKVRTMHDCNCSYQNAASVQNEKAYSISPQDFTIDRKKPLPRNIRKRKLHAISDYI